MTLWTGPFLPLAVLIWPLLLGLSVVLPIVRPHSLRLLLLAPAPALWLALRGADGASTAPELFLGVELSLEPASRLLLGMVAGLWLAAGVFAQSMAGGRNLEVFTGFWCLTLTGNLGVFLAGDVITFYLAFATVSLAAWFLVVHSRTDEALRAGKIYIVLAVVGEVCLLAGFLIGVQAADSFLIADMRAALAEAPLRGLAVGLLITGFGIKAGMVPLHVWLPLAHPAAPVAASAVLSGAIVKAGLVGLWLFMPPGAFGAGLMALGMAGAFGAALWGLTQVNPKAILAYSTVSQMGVMVALVGSGTAAQAVAFYAVHHGLAKGALFLSVGAVAVSGGRARLVMLMAAGLAALSVAGLPLTGGGGVKAAVKLGQSDLLALLITATGVTTTLIMGWFLWRLAQAEVSGTHARVYERLPVVALTLAAVGVPWIVWPQALAATPDYALSGRAIADAIWPPVIAGATALVALFLRLGPDTRPPGDLLRLLVFSAPAIWTQPRAAFSLDPARLVAFVTVAVARLVAVEHVLLRWRWSGLGILGVVVALVFLMD
ncbi:MAG: hypothetical protein JJU15_06030 [Pararhodobacter sp.]|nr:hypothetical protein [Pararhodobacter sp.]